MASELQVNTITEATSGSGITFAKDIIAPSALSHRNMIINGAMQVAQRGTSATFAHDGTTNGFVLDRFNAYAYNTDQWDGTVSQHSMSSAEYNTTGFANALKFLTGTAETAIAADEYARIDTKLEGQDIKHLQYGTASAKTTTLSFWVKSSVTGTYGLTMYSQCSQARALNKTYTIDTADTWEKKTLTIVGDTGQAHADDNLLGMMIVWSLASGSNYDGVNSTSWANYSTTNLNGGHAQDGVITTAGATFYLTGVQWELGSVATPFEHKSYADELARCQRYYFEFGNNDCMGEYADTTYAWFARTLPVPMRANPAMSYESNTALFDQWGIGNKNVSGFSISAGAFNSGYFLANATTNPTTSGTAQRLVILRKKVYLTAEL